MTQNIISIQGFLFLVPIPDDYYKAFINVPVNNYRLLVIIPEDLIHL